MNLIYAIKRKYFKIRKQPVRNQNRENEIITSCKFPKESSILKVEYVFLNKKKNRLFINARIHDTSNTIFTIFTVSFVLIIEI
jgi:hypothetical protein